MGAVKLSNLLDLRFAQRAGKSIVACYKSDLIDLEPYSVSHGNKAEGESHRERLKRLESESLSDSPCCKGNLQRQAEMTCPLIRGVTNRTLQNQDPKEYGVYKLSLIDLELPERDNKAEGESHGDRLSERDALCVCDSQNSSIAREESSRGESEEVLPPSNRS